MTDSWRVWATCRVWCVAQQVTTWPQELLPEAMVCQFEYRRADVGATFVLSVNGLTSKAVRHAQ